MPDPDHPEYTPEGEIRESFRVSPEPLPDGALELSHELMRGLVTELQERLKIENVRALELDYRQPARQLLKKYPKQVTAIFGVGSPGADIAHGLFNPENVRLILAQRSPGRDWGAGTWALPMGKIEEREVLDDQDSLGHVILRAGQREFSEEVHGDPPAGYNIVAGSFLDEQTERLIHVVVKELAENFPTESGVHLQLPDQREHTSVGWVDLATATKYQPMDAGTAYAIKTGLEFLDGQNREFKESGRYRDEL